MTQTKTLNAYFKMLPCSHYSIWKNFEYLKRFGSYKSYKNVAYGQTLLSGKFRLHICMKGNAFFEKLIIIGTKWKDVEIGEKNLGDKIFIALKGRC